MRAAAAPILFGVLAALLGLTAACGSSGPEGIVFVSEADGDAEISKVDPKTGAIVPLTDNRARDLGPIWSFDGKEVLYVSDEFGDLDVYRINSKGDLSERLTLAPGDDHSPLWAPGGEILAFVSNRDGNPEIYIMTSMGTLPTRVTTNTAEEYLGSWSPNGEWLALYRSGPSEERGLWLRNPDGVNVVRLTNDNDTAPVWSPDGRSIAFVRDSGGNSDIYTVSKLKNGSWQDDTEIAQLTQHADADLSPAWSPNGETLAFVSLRNGNAEIYIMRDDGANQVRLTTNDADDLDPVWSPDGQEIAFVSHIYGTGEIFLMRTDGGGQRRLTNNNAEDYSPDW